MYLHVYELYKIYISYDKGSPHYIVYLYLFYMHSELDAFMTCVYKCILKLSTQIVRGIIASICYRIIMANLSRLISCMAK